MNGLFLNLCEQCCDLQRWWLVQCLFLGQLPLVVCFSQSQKKLRSSIIITFRKLESQNNCIIEKGRYYTSYYYYYYYY